MASDDKTYCGQCDSGFGLLEDRLTCHEAEVGHYLQTLTSPEEIFPLIQVTPCPSGRYQDTPGQTTCELCPSGTYNEETGADSPDACRPCPGGAFEPEEGKQAPEVNSPKSTLTLTLPLLT